MAEVESAPVASPEVLASLEDALVVDARDPSEITGCKGGPALEGSVSVPFNTDGAKQSEQPTSAEDYRAKLEAAGCLPDDKTKAIITHCGAGGRGGKACTVIAGLGYANVHNGGSPDNIRKALSA
uniref:Rhodanese domain-containing protein n=1 Tax=Alexandrium catenella TaxID=2925 RepID=A0A7S1LSN3_ALECA